MNVSDEVKEEKWFQELSEENKFIYERIRKYHDYFSGQDKIYRKTHYKKSRHKVKISENNSPPLTRVNQMLADRQRGRWRE